LGQERHQATCKVVLGICISFILSACTSGSEAGSSDELLGAFTVSGSVGDGPIVGAEVLLVDANGDLVGSTTSNNQARYSIDIPGDTPLPVTATASGGTDLVTGFAADFALSALVHSTGEQNLNISPLTTLVARSAQCGNDTSATNLADILADRWSAVRRSLDIGIDSVAMGDPMSGSIGPDNVETFVLANEAMGEWIRRTGSGLNASGQIIELDEVVEVLACDLADGEMDGRLVAAVGDNDVRVLGTAKAAEIGVRLEVLAGRLEVNSFDASEAMNNAIRSIMPEKQDADVNSVPIASSAIDQAIASIRVLQSVYGDSELNELAQTLMAIDPSDITATVDAALSTGVQNTLTGFPQRVALADESEIRQLNEATQEQSNAPAPIISFAANPSSVATNTTTTLTWASTGASECVAGGDWSGEMGLQGAFQTLPLVQDSSFNLTCSGLGGVTSADVVVRVEAPPQTPPPTVSLLASALSVTPGSSVELSWSTTDANSCSATVGWTGSRPVQGQESVGPLQQSQTFVLECTGEGGTATDQVVVNVAQVPFPTVVLSSSATTIVSGEQVTLTWSSLEADACSASGGWSGNRGLSGQERVGPLNTDRTFDLTCSGAGGEVTSSVSIDVQQPSPPSLTFTSSVSQVQAGGFVTLAWATANASACVASAGWSGAQSTAGQTTLGPLDSDQNFILTCSGLGGEVSRSLDVAVAQTPGPVVSITASSTNVQQGSSTTLNWSAQNANSCIASNGWSGSRATTGQQSSGSLNANTTFTLTCTGAGGTDIASVVVTVTAAPPAPTVTLNAGSTDIESGTSTNLSWSSQNADSCTASGAWSGSRSTSGQQSTGNLNTDSTYTLTCTGQGGTDISSVTVRVSDPAPVPTVNLSVDNTTVNSGGTANLTWTSTDTTSCTASGGWSGSQAVAGSRQVGPLQSSQTFTLQCSGAGGNALAMVSVAVMGELVLEWQAPSENVDGTAVIGLSAYRIHYGTSSGQYDDVAEVAGHLSSATLNVIQGTYFVAMTAIDLDSEESGLSNEVQIQTE